MMTNPPPIKRSGKLPPPAPRAIDDRTIAVIRWLERIDKRLEIQNEINRDIASATRNMTIIVVAILVLAVLAFAGVIL